MSIHFHLHGYRRKTIAALVWTLVPVSPTFAQGVNATPEIGTSDIFGFTSGSGVGSQGDKEFSVESAGEFGKRDGHYTATETKSAFGTTPTQFIQLEFGAMGTTHNISGVTGIDDRRQIALSGAFAELRYQAMERTADWPLSVTLSFEPTWRRLDGTSGEKIVSYAFETKVNADLELIKNRVYAGFNFLYEPQTMKTPISDLEREATFGLSSALAFRIHPDVAVGGEVWYLRHYDSLGLSGYTGDAILFGPTLHVQLTPKTSFVAAWNAQVAGHEIGGSTALNLADFQRHRARLKITAQFN